MNKYAKLFARCYSSATVTKKSTSFEPLGAVHEHVWSKLDAFRDRTALSCTDTGRRINYGKLRRISGNLASWLNLNTSRGEYCVTVLPNSMEMAISALGAFEAGVPLAPLNPDYTPEEMATFFQSTDFHLRWLITTSSKTHDILDALRATNNPLSETGIIVVDDDIVFNGVTFFDEIVRDSRMFHRHAGQPALIVAGRAGFSQTVSHSNLMATCSQMALAGSSELKHGDRIGALLPMFNYNGLSSTVLQSLSNGSELTIVKDVTTERLLDELKRKTFNILHTVSPFIDILSETQPDLLTSIQKIEVCGRPSTASGRLCGKFHGKIVHNYGPPEGPIFFQQHVTHRDATDKLNSLVGVPLPGTQARVLDGRGKATPVNAEGEIWVKGPQVGDGNQWIPTGDLGFSDNDGRFYVNSEGEISVGGLKIVPSEIESVLQEHSSVVKAVVFPAQGSLVAAVIPSDAFNLPTAEELRLHTLSRLAPHKQISNVVFMSSIPQDSTGEADRRSLSLNYNPIKHEPVGVNFI